jgi:surface antigen
MGEPAYQLPEEDQPDIRPDLRALEGGGESTPRKEGHLRPVGDETARKDRSSDAKEHIASALSDQLGKGFTGGVAAATGGGAALSFAQRAGKFFLGTRRRKQATASSGVVTIIVAAVSVGSIWFAGPFEAIHVAQVLLKGHFLVNEDQGDERTGRMYRFLRSNGDIGETRLGFLASKYKSAMLTDLEKIGLKPIRGGAATFKGFEITRTKGSPYSGLSNEELKAKLAEKGINPKSITFDGNRATITSKGYFQKRTATKLLVRDMGYKGVSSALRSRILRTYYGLTWHPLKKIDLKVNEKLADAYKTWKEERDKRISNGVDESGHAKVSGSEDDTKSKLKSIASSKTLKIAGGLAAAQALVCGMHAVATNIDDIRYAEVILPLMRVSNDIISTGEQVRTNQDIDATGLSFVAKNFSGVDPETGKTTTWNQAESIQHQAGKTNSGIEAPAADQDIAGGVPSWLSWTNNGLVSKSCSTAAQWVGTGVSGAIGVISGGIVSTITSGIAGMLLVPHAIDAISGFLSGNAVDPDAQGAAWGSNADYGSALLANGQALQFGGGALSKTEVAQLQDQVNAEDAKDFASKSFAYKLFSPRDHRTLFAKMIDSSGMVQPQHIASTLTGTITNIGSVFTAPLSSLFAKAHADTGPFDYGFDITGFSQAEMNNPLVSDPYANGKAVAKLLDSTAGEKYIDQASECFGISLQKVTEDDQDVWAAVPDTTNNPDGINIYSNDYNSSKCRKGGSLNHNNWLRVRFFIFDSGQMDGYACFQGNEISCQHDGISLDSTSSTGAGANLRIATFNVLGAGHTSGDFTNRANKSITAIQSNGIEVVGMQEFRPTQRNYFMSKLTNYDNFPKGGNNDGHRIENSILWNKAKYTLVASGYQPGVVYFCGNKLSAPWVKLRNITTGQELYVLNTHDPAYAPASNPCSGDAARQRYENAKAHVAFLKQLQGEGLPMFFTGDFNSPYTQRSSGNGTAYQGKNKNLTYCIMTSSGLMNDAYDVYRNRPVKCPNPVTNKADRQKMEDIDHVYLSKGLSVTNWVPISKNLAGSDHVLEIFDVTIPSTNNGSSFTPGSSFVGADGFQTGNCVAYVKYILSRHSSKYHGEAIGDGKDFAQNLSRFGYTVNHTPAIHATVSFPTTMADPVHGHVALVAKINKDGSIVVEESNWTNSNSYGTHTVSASKVKFLTYAHTEVGWH